MASINQLNLGTRAYNALRRNGYDTIEQVQEFVKGDPSCDRLLALKNLGRSSQREIKLALRKWSKANAATS